MPELPEVETVVRSLRPHLVGRRMGPILLADDRVLRTPRRRLAALAGRTVAAVERIGKFIRIVTKESIAATQDRLCANNPSPLMGEGGPPKAGRVRVTANRPRASTPSPPPLSPQGRGGQSECPEARPQILTIHLGMAGRLLAVPQDSAPPRHAYFRMAILSDSAAAVELRFINPRWCMGGAWIARPDDPRDPTRDLGPDPLRITADKFIALLGEHRRQIKALLLDQTMLAGMGNIYCDESLFAARIHPRAIASELTRPRRRRLWGAMQDRLAEAIRRGGSTLRDYRDANGQAGWFQLDLKVYGRAGEPCPGCGSTIEHTVTAGRSTHFCRRCQRK